MLVHQNSFQRKFLTLYCPFLIKTAILNTLESTSFDETIRCALKWFILTQRMQKWGFVTLNYVTYTQLISLPSTIYITEIEVCFFVFCFFLFCFWFFPFVDSEMESLFQILVSQCNFPPHVSILCSIVVSVPVRCGPTLKTGSRENHWLICPSGPTLLALIVDHQTL